MADRAGKTGGIKNDKLVRELNKIELIERSDIRMLETSRHRLRSKLKRFGVSQFSSGSDAIDVRMYDTHNPGFCYRCTGEIKACDTSPREKLVDVFDVVHSMLFTNGEVDPDKVVCLHVLAAHYAKSGSDESSGIRPLTPLVEKGKTENFSGAWNSVLPCYVLEVQRNIDDVANFSDVVKRHKDPLVMEAEEEVIRDFESKYEKYLRENSDVGLALSTNHKRAKMVPNGIGKITIIPPHVYSLLGAAQELKIKQVIAEESRRKKFRRSNSSIKNVDDQSISFRLDDEEDAISRRLMTATSIRGWNGSRVFGTSKVSDFRSLSRRSATSSHKTEPSITMLKRASPRSRDVPQVSEDVRNDTEIVTIKSSNRTLARSPSKTSSTKSPFRNLSNVHDGPGSPCSYSITSGVSGSLGEPRKILKPIFINSPVKSAELRNKGYETVQILVNNQMQALVHSVLDVLERVNPSKMRRIVSTAKSPSEIRRMLVRPDIQLFVDSLAGQPLVSSPNNFVISMASIIHEIDPRLENSIEKELVATTLAVPPAPGLYRLVEEIRSNLFVDPELAVGSKGRMKIETFGCQKQKLLEFRTPCKEVDDEKDVFDVDTSCRHPDIEETKMSCANCYAKWKDSLPDTERSKIPDFLFVDKDESQIASEDPVTYKSDTRELNIAGIGKENVRKGQDSERKKKPDGTNVFEHPVQDPEIKTDLSSVTKTKHFHSSRGKPLKRRSFSKAWKESSVELKESERSLSAKTAEQQRASLYSVERKSRLSQNTSGNKLFEKSMRVGAKISWQKMNVDQIVEARSNEDPTRIAGLKTDCESMISTSLQKRCSKITVEDDAPSPKCQFKPWKASRIPGYLEPDRIILRRMTNPQRILVGQMCASLKTRKTNMEGLVKERTPLTALITPVLSHNALRILTKGTRQGLSRKKEIIEVKDDSATTVSEKLTGPVLAKVILVDDKNEIRQAVAENETNRRLSCFLESRV